MDKLLYIAMSGAKQTMLAQTVNANNLANVNTTGFRADLAAFESLPVNGPGYASRAYAQSEGLGANFATGSLLTTGRDLDVAVRGDGYIAVLAPDGTEAYTRAGDLRVDSGGQLVNGAGHRVLGNGGPLAIPPHEKLEVGTDGTISIRPVGQQASALATLDRIKLVNAPPGSLQKGADGLLRPVDGGQLQPNASVQLVSGALESSNVNAVEAMVNMISLSRHFEMQVKTMKSAEENDRRGDELLRLT